MTVSSAAREAFDVPALDFDAMMAVPPRSPVVRANLRMARGKAPIVNAVNPVELCGEALSEPVVWVGRQWAVTTYGIECRDGRYTIKASQLWSGGDGWNIGVHMAEKEWVDVPDFLTALLVARGHFGSPAA